MEKEDDENVETYMCATLCALASGMARAQPPEFAILDIEWENSVAYYEDVADASGLVTSPGPVPTTLRNFMQLPLLYPSMASRPEAL